MLTVIEVIAFLWVVSIQVECDLAIVPPSDLLRTNYNLSVRRPETYVGVPEYNNKNEI